MAGHAHSGSLGLEDQVRSMILGESPSRSTGMFDANAGSPTHPTIRLPPAGPYSQPSQSQQDHHRPRHSWETTNGQSFYNGPPRGHLGPAFGGQQPPQYGRQQQSYPPHPFQRNRPQQQGYGPGPGPRPSYGSSGPPQRGRNQQHMQLDPNAFHRGGFGRAPAGRGHQAQQLFNPNDARAAPPQRGEQQRALQTQYLENLAAAKISSVEMSPAEYNEKDSFRAALERICLDVCNENPQRLPKIALEPFGSFKSGFATAGSDMDLVIVVQDGASSSACFSLLEDDLPRVLEKRLLELGFGARLLTRTRVPIIKVCEKPAAELIEKLREEREKWDGLSDEQKYPHLCSNGNTDGDNGEQVPAHEGAGAAGNGVAEALVDSPRFTEADAKMAPPAGQTDRPASVGANGTAQEPSNGDTQQTARPTREDSKPWMRERKAGPLDFPKSGVGIQCDIIFFNPLGLHNTQLLRCYSLCDPRVRPMVLFVKAWAKHRKINSSYSGTLSSYGYVLMVLHYLTNVVNPPVLQNLQQQWTPLGQTLPDGFEVDGWQVRFWRDEAKITAAAQRGQLTQNRQPLGSLLAGFFHYYSSLGGGVNFHWMQQVLSLRTRGGILTKEEKGWVRAMTEEGEGKKIQHRYLFCIEDPFELSHNVARTVTHKGIVAIRDEFRRAHRILTSVGMGHVPREGELFADLIETEDYLKAAEELKANGAKATNGTKPANGSVNGAAAPKDDAASAKQLPQQPPKVLPPHARQQRQPSRGKAHPAAQQPPRAHPKSFNVNDSDAFPSLAGAGSKTSPGRKKGAPLRDSGSEFSEISGDKARAYLEEVRMKRLEAQAESTATLAAESVLEGDD